MKGDELERRKMRDERRNTKDERRRTKDQVRSIVKYDYNTTKPSIPYSERIKQRHWYLCIRYHGRCGEKRKEKGEEVALVYDMR